MSSRASGRALLIVLTVFLLVSCPLWGQSSPPSSRGAAAQKSDSTRYVTPITTANKQNMLNHEIQHIHDPELQAILKAEQEGRWLDAEKLLNAAVGNAEALSAPATRLRFLLNQLGSLEFRLGQYTQAVSTAQRVLSVDMSFPPAGRQLVPFDYQNLAIYSERAEDPATAEKAYKEGVALARKNPGPQKTSLLTALTRLEGFYRRQRRTADARALQQEATQICESQPEPRAARCEVILGGYYRRNGHAGYAEDVLSQQASQVASGQKHSPYFDKLFALVALAHQYEQDKSYDLAEATYQKTIALAQTPTRKYPGKLKNPPLVAALYDQLGRAYQMDARDQDAETAYQRAFNLRVQAAATDRSVVGPLAYSGLARFYQMRGRLTDADHVLSRALAVQERVLDPQDIRLARTLTELARVKTRESEYYDAEPLCRHALKIEEADFGSDSPRLFRTVAVYAQVEQKLGNAAQAEALMARARALRQEIRARQSVTAGPVRTSPSVSSQPATLRQQR